MIAVVDYGAGNVASVCHALEHLGRQPALTAEPSKLLAAQGIILPGVGAFGDAMEQLRARGLDVALRQAVQADKPFLGICIGEQLIFESSEESPGVAGLSLLDGWVARIPAGAGRKVPHMGWNQLNLLRPDPLFDGLPQRPYFYFVHSYYTQAARQAEVLAQVEYGARMDVAVRRGNLWAVQFHPEKSGENGLKLLANFMALCEGEE